MNIDAALVLQFLRSEKVPRQVRTIHLGTGLPSERIRAALQLLKAIDKVAQSEGGAWRLVYG